MLQKSFKFRVIIPTVIVLVILVAALSLHLAVSFSTLSESLINDKLDTNINTLKNYLVESEANSKTAAVTMTFNANAIKAIKERDTEKLLELFAPTQDMYRINFFTICDNMGVVLARTHEPHHYGDSIFNQQNVKDALAGKVSTYFEEGTAVKVSVRTGAPVYDTNGTLIGVISTGTRFDTDKEIERLRSILNSDITVFKGDSRIATTMINKDGHRYVGTPMDPEIAEVVVANRQEYKGDEIILGEKHKTFYMPLFNPQNNVFATFVLSIPEKEIVAGLNKSLRNGIIIGNIGLIIASVLLFLIISSISKPITKLSTDMISLANGKLNVVIEDIGDDEIGQLGISVQKVADIIHKLIKDINDMIAEQAKGNTDYYLDIDEFSGDYKVLAENILRLATVNIIDQLTGLPNRHSFDNRLEWEWNRSLKENASIGILLLAIDDFDNYNTSFGQLQGGVCLRTAAKIIRQFKRPDDFAARWGGEKFIVLLPGADSTTALDAAETIRSALKNTTIPCLDDKGRRITVSIGVSTKVPDDDSQISDLVSLADVSLYQARSDGKNRVVMCQLGFDEENGENNGQNGTEN